VVEPIRCGACKEPTHTPYTSDVWQITETIVDCSPDGSVNRITPFAAIACSAECARQILTNHMEAP
jgi:hypothetical protein